MTVARAAIGKSATGACLALLPSLVGAPSPPCADPAPAPTASTLTSVDPPRHRLELGARGAAGAVFGGGDTRGGGGGIVYPSYPFAHERWEAELSLGVVATS